jgi:hypothetical protein
MLSNKAVFDRSATLEPMPSIISFKYSDFILDFLKKRLSTSEFLEGPKKTNAKTHSKGHQRKILQLGATVVL